MSYNGPERGTETIRRLDENQEATIVEVSGVDNFSFNPTIN